MRRYYACIVGKYGQPVQRALAKVAPLDIAMICSTHGPVWRREIARVVELYDKVSRYEGEPGAVIAYGSMYGNTEQMAETVARGLAAAGVRPIVVYNLSTADVSQVLRDIFRYDTLVVGSPTYNGQLYPPVDALLRKIAERCIPHRRFACFGCRVEAGVFDGCRTCLPRAGRCAGRRYETIKRRRCANSCFFRCCACCCRSLRRPRRRGRATG